MCVQQKVKMTNRTVFICCNASLFAIYFVYGSFVVKRPKADEVMSSSTSSNGVSSVSVDLNLPLPGGKCCLVKVTTLTFKCRVQNCLFRYMMIWTLIVLLTWWNLLEFCHWIHH